MYEITINEQVYSFNFGMGFLREMNKLVKTTADGSKLEQNIGFRYYLADMIDGNPEALVTILNVANKGQSPRVTMHLLDSYIDDPETDIDKIYEDLLGFFKSANSTKRVTTQMLTALKLTEA